MKSKIAQSSTSQHSHSKKNWVIQVSSFLRREGVMILLILLFTLPITLKLMQPGTFIADDNDWLTIRSTAFHEALRDGQFPVRYVGRLFHEYGYPVTTFLYPGYLYLTEPLILVGFNFVTASNIMFGLAMISSGIFVYFWLRTFFDKWIALVSSLIYIYTPYHLVDLFKRGSLGELLSLAIVPFILWQIERRSVVFVAFGIAGLLTSHNIMAVLFLPVIFCYAVLRSTGAFKERLLYLLITFSFGFGLAAFFWLPAVAELSYTVFQKTVVSDWTINFVTLERIGFLSVALVFLASILLLFRRHFAGEKYLFKNQGPTNLLVFFLIICLFSLYISGSWSTAVWHVLPVTFIQFPFRFLSLELISVAFLGAYVFSAVRIKEVRVIIIITALIILASNAYSYFKEVKFIERGEGFYTTNQGSSTIRDEYTPVWVKEKPIARAEKKVEIIKGQGQITDVTVNNVIIMFGIQSQTEALVQINKIYWPGWVASIDGQSVTIDYDNPKGLMTIQVPAGTHTVSLRFTETPLRLVADGVSLVSFVLLLLLSIVFHRKGSKTHR